MLKKEYGYVTLVWGTVEVGKTTTLLKDALESKEDNIVFLSVEVPQPKIYERIVKLGYNLSEININVIDPKCYDMTNYLKDIIEFYKVKILYIDQFTLLGPKDIIFKLSELAHDLNISIICSTTITRAFVTSNDKNGIIKKEITKVRNNLRYDNLFPVFLYRHFSGLYGFSISIPKYVSDKLNIIDCSDEYFDVFLDS